MQVHERTMRVERTTNGHGGYDPYYDRGYYGRGSYGGGAYGKGYYDRGYDRRGYGDRYYGGSYDRDYASRCGTRWVYDRGYGDYVRVRTC